LSILYLSVTTKEPNRTLRAGLVWVGALAFLPFILDVIGTAESTAWEWRRAQATLPAGMAALGYGIAYVPALAIAIFTRKKRATPMFVAALWVLGLSLLGRQANPEHNPWLYLWVGVGACGLCYWGMKEGRRLLINYGTALFALTVITFYFSDVLDKLGRSLGLILMGVIFLAGGWVLNRLRADLIARAAAAKGGTE
ncbi:MAG TPA: hypothetical protein VFL42_08230, partial [Terriglobales bacterium]|nr:hypothetical protein [Terriglobales bacterium]